MRTATQVRASAQLPPGPIGGIQWREFGMPPARAPGPPRRTAMSLHYQGAHSVTQQQKSWTGVSANIAEVRCDGRLDVDLGANSTRLSVALEEVGGRFEIRSRRDASVPRDVLQPLSIIPAGLAARGRADGLSFLRHLVLRFDVATLARMMEGEIDLVRAFAPRLMFADAGILRLAELLADECTSDAPHGRLYGDNLSMALLLAVARLSAPKPPSFKHGRLAPWQLRRVTDFLTAHLAEDIQLQTVSDLVRLSRSYFSRAFKISTGLAPHQWLLQARIAKAKQRLLQADCPLAQIAIEVGFADQAHFTRTFRRAVGESPGAWQRARRA